MLLVIVTITALSKLARESGDSRAIKYVISVCGDVYRDRRFFTKTYPWLVDNIGGEVVIGGGRHAVPQMCALSELRPDAFLQAQFLKCEADGSPRDECVCETGIDLQRYKYCVLNKGSMASFADSKCSQMGIEAGPVIEIGPRNTVFEVSDNWYLKKICTIFGDSLPRGCVKPFACNYTETEYSGTWWNNFECTECHSCHPCTRTTPTYSTIYETTTTDKYQI